MHKETNFRALAKTLSWRALATCTTIGIVYGFIGKLSVAFAIGGVEVIALLFL